MKTGKKVLGAVLAAAMALSSITPVFAADKVKITFMSRDSGDTPMAKVYEDQIAAFMEENPDIEVQNDSVYEESAYNNKLPNELNVDAIFYNKALFEKAGIEKTPETMDELYEDIDKLVAAGITPFGVGGKNTWVMGHIFNNILAKRIGRDGIIKLGTGEKKWTDDDVVECLQITKDLKDKGAFAEGFEGMDYNTQMNQFLTGEVAMISHSSPIIPEMFNSESEILDDISFFAFPYFEDKPEYKDTHVVYTSGWMLSGTMSDEEKEATLKLVKYMTSKESIQERMNAAMRVAPYKDIDAPEDAPQIFKDMVEYTGTITDSVGEYFDYDTCSTLVDTSRNGILNMMLSDSAENTAQTIQADIDANRPQS